MFVFLVESLSQPAKPSGDAGVFLPKLPKCYLNQLYGRIADVALDAELWGTHSKTVCHQFLDNA